MSDNPFSGAPPEHRTAQDALRTALNAERLFGRGKVTAERRADVISRNLLHEDLGYYDDPLPAYTLSDETRDRLIAHARQDAAQAVVLTTAVLRQQRRLARLIWAALALLAVIAGTLIFGQNVAAVALTWCSLIAGGLVAVVMALRLLAWVASGALGAVQGVRAEWHSDAPLSQKLASAAGLFLFPFFVWIGLTWTWLWLSGTPNLKDAFAETAAFKGWLVVLAALFVGAIALGLIQAGRWLSSHKTELPGRAKTAGLYWLIGVFAFIAFPVNEYRHRRREGSGALGTMLGPLGMLIVGAAVSLSTVMFSMLAALPILLALGVVE